MQISRATSITALGKGIAAEWQYGGSLILFEGADDAVDAKMIVEAACEGLVVMADCARVFRTQAELLTLARLQFTVLSAFSAGQRAAFVRYLTGLEERWRRYHLDARANLPWELWLNGRLLAEPAAGCGFIEPPERQIILLHPIPLLVARGATTDDMTGAIGIELIGLYAWRWEGTQMRSPWRGAPGFLDRSPLGGSLLLGFDGDDDRASASSPICRATGRSVQ